MGIGRAAALAVGDHGDIPAVAKRSDNWALPQQSCDDLERAGDLLAEGREDARNLLQLSPNLWIAAIHVCKPDR